MKDALVYLDWNVFNKIEGSRNLSESERRIYFCIEGALLQKKIISPYSNAHINDLIRGYLKDPAYIEGHLHTLNRLTGNLCITQYWGEDKSRWHFRNIKEFFDATLTERSQTAKDFYSLLDINSPDVLDTLLSTTHKARCELMKLQPVDKKFLSIYKEDPIFNSIYSRTKVELNQYALCEDLYNFSEKIKTDYALYKNYRRYLNQLRLKFPQLANTPAILQFLKRDSKSQPKQISWDELWEDVTPNYKPSSNPAFDKLFDHFVKIDLKGYRPDERFANLIDDALHVYYGSNCQYFVTLDARCYDKAEAAYAKYAPKTVVLKPEKLYELLSV